MLNVIVSPIVIRIDPIRVEDQERDYQLDDQGELQMTMTEDNNTGETEFTQEVERTEGRKDTLQIGGRTRVSFYNMRDSYFLID